MAVQQHVFENCGQVQRVVCVCLCHSRAYPFSILFHASLFIILLTMLFEGTVYTFIKYDNHDQKRQSKKSLVYKAGIVNLNR